MLIVQFSVAVLQKPGKSTPRLFLKQGAVSFDNIPFSLEEVRILDCQYGEHYFKKREKGSKTLRLQGSRKIGCQAKIRIKCYTTYPDHALPDTTNMTSRQAKQTQQNALDKLRKALESGEKVNMDTKYFVSLPSIDAHSGHPLGCDACGFAQRIHPLVTQKITELVSSGITDIGEVKRHLHFYVTKTVPKELGIHPKPNNRAFHPTTVDIRNHIWTAKKALELSKIDQENVRCKIENWKQSNPNSSFFFRPYIKNEDASPETISEGKPIFSNSGHYNGNSGTEDNGVNIVGSDDNCSQTLLVVHQENWQKEMLAKYGNTLALLDATYKTTRYDLALFFLCVRTNVGYSVVAEFVTQSETACQIGEALQIIKMWNPKWNPAFFMSDYSEAELLAIEQVFPESKTFLCDFHREQAWERWTKDHKHGLTSEQREELLHLLRECAHAPPADPASALPQDALYKQAVAILQQSQIWKQNKAVQQWLNNYWLNIAEV